MEDKNDLPEEQFLLNPSCSELIGALKINNDQDFKLVLIHRNASHYNNNCLQSQQGVKSIFYL